MKYTILLYGFHKLSPRDIENSAAYTECRLQMTSVSDNLFSLGHYHACMIYAEVDNAEELIAKFKVHSPNIPLVVFTDKHQPGLLEQNELVWYADSSDRTLFLYSLKTLWRFLEAVLNAKSGALDNGGYSLGGGVFLPLDSTYMKAGKKYLLTYGQNEMLKLLIQYRGQTVSRVTIMDTVWKKDKFVSDRVIDTNMVHLRKLLGSQGRSGSLIQTCHGQGYRLLEELPKGNL
ncbi:MAG: winged helix-turn-helix domain-containing protein [Brevinema sp.]